MSSEAVGMIGLGLWVMVLFAYIRGRKE